MTNTTLNRAQLQDLREEFTRGAANVAVAARDAAEARDWLALLDAPESLGFCPFLVTRTGCWHQTPEALRRRLEANPTIQTVLRALIVTEVEALERELDEITLAHARAIATDVAEDDL